MSLHLEFDPHSWYMGWAIKKSLYIFEGEPQWSAYTANGMTGFVEELHANTLKELKQKIKQRTQAESERVARLYGGTR